MFELQNNRGKNLTNMEKLKSYFLYQMYVNSTAEETDANIEIVSNHFKEIYKNAYDIKGLDEDSILIYHCFAYLNVSFNYRNLDDIKRELVQNEDKVRWIKDFSRQLSITRPTDLPSPPANADVQRDGGTVGLCARPTIDLP